MESTIKSMKLSGDVITGINKAAKKQNRSFSNMVETVLKEWIENQTP